MWFRHGVQTRDDGPAIEFPNGSYMWLKDGLPHRVGGPAIRFSDGKELYFLNGNQLTTT